MQIGQYALIKADKNRVLITGFYKVVPEPKIDCAMTREILDEIIAEEKAEQIANNTYREKVIIASCSLAEAELIGYKGKHTGFHSIHKEFTLLEEMIDSKTTLEYYQDRNTNYAQIFTKGDYRFTHKISKIRL
jgi:hypothetical protein